MTCVLSCANFLPYKGTHHHQIASDVCTRGKKIALFSAANTNTTDGTNACGNADRNGHPGRCAHSPRNGIGGRLAESPSWYHYCQARMVIPSYELWNLGVDYVDAACAKSHGEVED